MTNYAEIPFEPQQPALDPGRAEYWDDVKKRTRIRNATQAAKSAAAKLRPTQIYEQYVDDHREIVAMAIRKGKITCPDEITKFTADCAEWMRLPELTYLSDDEIRTYASEAITEAAELLYGE